METKLGVLFLNRLQIKLTPEIFTVLRPGVLAIGGGRIGGAVFWGFVLGTGGGGCRVVGIVEVGGGGGGAVRCEPLFCVITHISIKF